jgi:hypothetical protein
MLESQGGLPVGYITPGGPGKSSGTSKTKRSVEAPEGLAGSGDWYKAPFAPRNWPVPPVMASGRDEENRTRAANRRVTRAYR